MQFLSSSKSNAAAFGLDISPSGIKFVQLRQTKKGLALDAAGNVPFMFHSPDHAPLSSLELQHQLENALKTHSGHTLSKNVVASLPESKTFMEIVSIPKRGDEAFEKRLLETIPEYLPLPAEESYFDSSIIREEADGWVALVGAAPKVTVDQFLLTLQASGLTPLALDIEAPAIARAVLRGASEQSGATAILDLGQSHAALILLERDNIQFTMNLPIAGDRVTNEIGAALKMNQGQAENAKRACSDQPDQCPAELRVILGHMVEDITSKIREAETYYADHFNEAGAITKVYLCGGGAHLALLNTTLATSLGIPVEVANPWHDIENPPSDSPLSLTTALGLALRALHASTAI